MQTPMRTARRVTTALVPFALLVTLAGPASAETPRTWDNPEGMSTLNAILIFGGGTLALVIILGIFGALTQTKKTMKYPIRREHDGSVMALAQNEELRRLEPGEHPGAVHPGGVTSGDAHTDRTEEIAREQRLKEQDEH